MAPSEAVAMSDATAQNGSASSASTTVTPVEDTGIGRTLPGMMPDAQKECTEVPVDAEGPADGEMNDGEQQATAVLPRNGHGQKKTSQKYSDEAEAKRDGVFWRYWSKIEQQEIPSYTLPLRAFCRPAQVASASCCAVLFAALSGILLSVAASFKETVVSYSYTHDTKDFTIDKDIEGPVLVWYEIPNLLLNHKYAVQGKDKYLWKNNLMSAMSEYNCDSAESVKDALWRRPGSVGFIQRLSQAGSDLRPCGLVGLAMYTDTFDLLRIRGTTVKDPEFHLGLSKKGTRVILDTTDLVLETDKAIYKDKFKPKSGSTLLEIDGKPSWLGGEHLERFKVWYRTPVSPTVRQLYARVSNGLPAGDYALNFTVNDPVFEKYWDVPEKRIIFSTQKPMGNVGAYRSLGIFCILVAVFEAISSILFLVAPLIYTSGASKTVPSSKVMEVQQQ